MHILNLLLRILPLFIGAGLAFVVATNVMSLDKITKFVVSSISMLLMSYFFTRYNIWMMKRSGELTERKVLNSQPLGHALNVIGALCLGYGFVENNKILMLISFGFIAYADTLLTKTKLNQARTTKASNKNKIDPKEDALLRAINNRKAEDPLVGLKIGSKEILQRLLESLKGDKGVHVESLLGIVGSLAGYSCHAACREEFVETSKMSEKEAFTVFSCKDGKNYYFGDLPNKPLVEDKFSVWGLVAGTTQHLGGELYDVNSTFSNVAGAMGSKHFGIPQVPDQHKPGDLPLNYVRDLWPVLLPIIDKFCTRPLERPILLGLVAQQVVEMGKDVIEPSMASKLVMECAAPMAKIGPEWLA